jgi:predicted ATPase/class 3 adenylate cyclase
VRPTGLVTFLFTDVEGSTRMWAEHTAAMEPALGRHDDLLRALIDARHGYVFSIAGDSFGAAFTTTEHAVAAAVDAQIALHAEPWAGLPGGLRVRMGLHRGTAQERAGNYFGPAVNLAARVMSAAWGGQILCTDAVADGGATTFARLGEHHLRDVDGAVAIHQIVAPELPADFPPPRTLDVAPTTIPAQRSSFVGRGEDIAAVRRLLLDHRLVTLTGPGGTGKTRLAIEIAGREQPHHAGGTFFADLASLENGDLLPATVARACLVALDASRAPLDQLTDALKTRDVLLVLDNCEHVLDAAAELTDRVLAACSGVVVLATSREPLELAGEHIHVVAPLPTAAGSDAASLFVQRAAAAGGDVLDARDAGVAELCTRLDGIPLAIELAAARARTSSPAQTLARLDGHLDVLSGTRRRVPDRHQTLRAAISWSYQLLTDRERALFDRLAVFAGSFDLDAAASVAGTDDHDVADLLHDLVSKSMVEIHSGREGGRRYRLLNSLRAYAEAQLRTQPAFADATRAHTWHYLDALASVPTSRNIARSLWAELEADLDDILVAIDRAVATDDRKLHVAAARATEPLAFLLTNTGMYDEARRRCEAALEIDVDDALRGQLLVARAFMEASQDGISDFVSFAGRALQYLEPGDGVWSAAMGMTSIVEQIFFPETATTALEHALQQLDGKHTEGADHDRAMLGFYLGGALMNRRDYAAASEVQLRSGAALTTIEPTSLIRLWSAAGAAMSLTMLGRSGGALELLEDVSALADWTDWSADWFFARAVALAYQGSFDDAHATLCSIGTRFDNVDVSPMTSTVIAGFGVVAHMDGDDGRARALFEPLIATRTPMSTAVLYESLAELDAWSAADFLERRLEWLGEVSRRHETAPRAAFFDWLRRLLREELAR